MKKVNFPFQYFLEYQRNFIVYNEGEEIDNVCKEILISSLLDIVIDGEFEAKKCVMIGNKKSPEDELISDFIQSNKFNKSITRVQKEQIHNYAKSLSNSSSEATLDAHVKNKVFSSIFQNKIGQ